MNRPELERVFLGLIKESARCFGFSTWEPNGKISNFNKHEWSIYCQCIIRVQQTSHLPEAILLISSDEWIDATLLSAGKGTVTFQTRKQRYCEGNLLGRGYFGRQQPEICSGETGRTLGATAGIERAHLGTPELLIPTWGLTRTRGPRNGKAACVTIKYHHPREVFKDKDSI